MEAERAPLASCLVHWNGAHLSVFEFRLGQERDPDVDAAAASI
jgi:hypothetical protein